ncbi:MAG: superoxide dismutase family protein [Parachlamydiaceae bacterium]|nr:superoxide dismutase family protein [Parachlamydiaceae bacterium]
MFKKTHFIIQIIPAALLIGLLGSCACTDTRKPEADKEKNQNEVAFADAINENGEINIAIANVKGIGDHQVNGTVTFTKVDGGIKIVADLEGLPPGKHGFHVHEHGDCGEGGHSAGGHFNPTNQKHGGPDSAERHVGDFGNVEANSKGVAHYERVDTLITFEGENSIIGRSIIIHADPDDLTTQPTGNSGARIGCGIIEPPSVIR